MLHLGKALARRYQIQPFTDLDLDAVQWRVPKQNGVNTFLTGTLSMETRSQVILRVEINYGDALALQGDGVREIQRGRRFPDPAFLIHHGDDTRLGH